MRMLLWVWVRLMQMLSGGNLKEESESDSEIPYLRRTFIGEVIPFPGANQGVAASASPKV
jgi:hypothetical protein